MGATDALQEALAAEHAAIWGYGVVGAAVADDVLARVRAAEQVHRGRREDAAALLRAAGAVPVPPAASYELPFDVVDSAAALRLAALLEDGCAAAWHYLLGQTEDTDLRGTGLAALTACAVQATRWRRTAGISPATVAFPGQ